MGCASGKATGPSQAANGTLLRETGQAGTEYQKPTSEENTKTIDITIKKTQDNSKLGLNGEIAGECWLVKEITDGLVKLWNEQNKELAVEVGDKIISCNGVLGAGEKILDAMKKGMDLQLKIAKLSAPPEKTAPVENDEVVGPDAGVEAIPESGDQELDALRSRLADSLDLSLQSGDLAAAISASAPTQDEAANRAISTTEEHIMPDNDCTIDPPKQSDGWMCCSK